MNMIDKEETKLYEHKRNRSSAYFNLSSDLAMEVH